jgi:hypothetical protein
MDDEVDDRNAEALDRSIETLGDDWIQHEARYQIKEVL